MTYFITSRSSFSAAITTAFTVGIEDAKVNKYVPGATKEVSTYTTVTTSEFITGMATIPMVGLTCITAGVRVYKFYQVIRKFEAAVSETDDYSFAAVAAAKAVAYSSGSFTVDVVDAGVS